MVALAQYDLDGESSSHSGSEFRSKRLANATEALVVFDDLHPAEALAALEIDGEQWNRSHYERRRAQLLAKLGAHRP